MTSARIYNRLVAWFVRFPQIRKTFRGRNVTDDMQPLKKKNDFCQDI